MAKIIGLEHTDGMKVRLEKFSLSGSEVFTGSPQNDGILVIQKFRDQAMMDSYDAGTLDEFTIVKKTTITINSVLDKMGQTPDGTMTDGERLWFLVYDFIKNKLGTGWSFIYET